MDTIRPISHSLQCKAFLELNEIPQNIAKEIAELRRLILGTPHLKSRLDDQFLVAFLRNCKHNVKDTLKKIEIFYSCRSSLPELMENRDPVNQRIREILRLGVGLPLPFTEKPDSPRVILIRVGAYESTQYSIIDIMKVANMICDILLYEDDNILISGEIAIVDFKNVTKGHLLQLQPSLVKKLSAMNQEGTPFRPVGIHYLNTPPGFEVVFNIFKNMLKTSNTPQVDVVIHPNSHETLHDHISPHILPAEYGGCSGPLEAIVQFWENKILSYRDFFLSDVDYGIDESKRQQEMPHWNNNTSY